MTAPYLAPSLAVLRAEINARWPHRDHTSDGWIGDSRHQASTSDHNPNARGSVNAIDVDEDGVDFAVVFAAIKRHPSARYVIYERRLYHRLRGWKSEPYSGDNPHDKHFHISIDQTRTAEQDRRPWGLLEDDVTKDEIKQAVLDALREAQPFQSAGIGNANPGVKLSARTLLEYGWSDAKAAHLLAVNAAGQDADEQAIITGVLAGLAPERIAAAIPPSMAKQVADELARRLVAETTPQS